MSIVSLEFFLGACEANREECQTPTEWGKAVRERIQPSTMSLRCYGGTQLTIVGQIVCCLSMKGCTVDTLLQVQEKAPVDLLLGMDTLRRLGFTLTQAGQGDLLAGQLESNDAQGDTARPATGGPRQDHLSTAPIRGAKVKLIQAARLPAGHIKIV